MSRFKAFIKYYIIHNLYKLNKVTSRVYVCTIFDLYSLLVMISLVIYICFKHKYSLRKKIVFQDISLNVKYVYVCMYVCNAK